nr:hypothetical protein [Tanacetum cinerariifolium]
TTATTTTLLRPPPPQQQSTTYSLLSSRFSTLEQRCVDLEIKHKLQDQTTQALSSRIFTLELRDLPHKINQSVNEVVKEVNLVNPEGHRVVPDVNKLLPLGGNKERRSALSISKLKAAYYPDFRLEELVPSLWIKSEQEYEADYNEYKISEADFRNLHPNDFEDLYLLHIQGQLIYVAGANNVHLFNAVNMWIRNIVIRKRMEDLQLGIESYQTNSISLNRIEVRLTFCSKKITP